MKKIFLCLYITSAFAMQKETSTEYTGCRYAYFQEHKNLPDSDHALYVHFSRIVTFLNALAQKFGKTITGKLKMEMGQTKQGLYLTNATPPAIITPWGKWLNLIFDEENSFATEDQRKFRLALRKYLTLGKWEVKQMSATVFICARPILGYNNENLPEAIFCPYEEFTKIAPRAHETNPLQALIHQSDIDMHVLKTLEYRHKNSQITLKQLCLQTIEKENSKKEEQKNDK